ncbi:hypothetical protein COCCU_05000 [Corynebacterium occultum]|uniref:Uncharacterized protein n=1 Tax=Corynebacterium occultum TaxID=2675219 RepID=A0A6B8W7T9_9CORY|nr:hypothetical protein [Corynebacterium occultum]QGU06946.1 hypothetical protein COCCU_05000 [Corynebacterium occultum]
MNPLWDVFFTYPGLDFTRTSARGDSVYRFLLRHRSVFAELIGRLHEYMDGQGQPIPRPGEDLRDNFPA